MALNKCLVNWQWFVRVKCKISKNCEPCTNAQFIYLLWTENFSTQASSSGVSKTSWSLDNALHQMSKNLNFLIRSSLESRLEDLCPASFEQKFASRQFQLKRLHGKSAFVWGTKCYKRDLPLQSYFFSANLHRLYSSKLLYKSQVEVCWPLSFFVQGRKNRPYTASYQASKPTDKQRTTKTENAQIALGTLKSTAAGGKDKYALGKPSFTAKDSERFLLKSHQHLNLTGVSSQSSLLNGGLYPGQMEQVPSQ